MTDLLLIVAGGVVLALGGYSFGVSIGTEKTRQAAIDVGSAQWTINPQTGARYFEFKSGPKVIPNHSPLPGQSVLLPDKESK